MKLQCISTLGCSSYPNQSVDIAIGARYHGEAQRRLEQWCAQYATSLTTFPSRVLALSGTKWSSHFCNHVYNYMYMYTTSIYVYIYIQFIFILYIYTVLHIYIYYICIL